MNRITRLLNIAYPIIQGGMIWCSGWELASAVSNAGGLGLIGSGSMSPDLLRKHIRKSKQATRKPFGVNIPLLYHGNEAVFRILIEEEVKIVVTSAGNPATWTPFLKNHGLIVLHVVANVKSARKCEDAGVDAIVAEGVEAGGHNGKEETTTMVLIPGVKQAVTLPVVAAGGIGSGRAMLAAFALGAEAVQIGSLFAASVESSAHPAFKQKITETQIGDTSLALKRIVPVRLIRNHFANEVRKLEEQGASVEELSAYLGSGRAKRGMFEGELEDGELEIGQVSGMIQHVKPVRQIVEELIRDYMLVKEEVSSTNSLFKF